MTTLNKMQSIEQLVINWHVNEACNFSCRYCYAKWKNQGKPTDVIRDYRETEEFLERIYEFFSPENTANPLQEKVKWKTVRLNIAGGEPMLYKKQVLHALKKAKALGFQTSIITNGSYLDLQTLREYSPALNMLGISIDSANHKTNTVTGRISPRGDTLNLDTLAADLAIIRNEFSELKLKLNTVVNANNHEENLTKTLNLLNPDKWKVFRVLPIVDRSTEVSKLQFKAFVDRHSQFSEITFVEKNTDMISSYIMLDPTCRFFQNDNKNPQTEYSYSNSVLNSSVESAFSQIEFSQQAYSKRYRAPTAQTKTSITSAGLER